MNTLWRWGTVLFVKDGAKNIPFTNCRRFWSAGLPSHEKIWSSWSSHYSLMNAFLSFDGSLSNFAFFQHRTSLAMMILSKFCIVALRELKDNSTKCLAFCRSSFTKWAYPTLLSASPNISLHASVLALCMIASLKQYGLLYGSRIRQRFLFDAIGISAIVLAMSGNIIAALYGLRGMFGFTSRVRWGDPTECLPDSSSTLHLWWQSSLSPCLSHTPRKVEPMTLQFHLVTLVHLKWDAMEICFFRNVECN